MKRKTKEFFEEEPVDVSALRHILKPVPGLIHFCNKKDAQALKTQTDELNDILDEYEALLKKKQSKKIQMSLYCLSMAIHLTAFSLQLSLRILATKEKAKNKKLESKDAKKT